MVRDHKANLVGLVLGVKFSPNFAVEDKSGDVVDKILYSKDPYFSQEVFPRHVANGNGRILDNPTNKDKLIIDNSNIVLDLSFSEQDSFFKVKDVEEIVDNFKKCMIKGILMHYNIRGVLRYGVLRKFIYEKNKFSAAFQQIVDKEIVIDPTDLNISFSKRLPIEESLVKDCVNDFDNVNYNIMKNSNSSELSIFIDYQRYFSPSLQTGDNYGKNFESFLLSSNRYYKEKFLEWINKFYIE